MVKSVIFLFMFLTSMVANSQDYQMLDYIGELQKKAQKGDVEAICKLGVVYINFDRFKNFDKAFKCFKMAADKGDALAMANLAVMYLKGEGTNRDERKTIEYLIKASDGGNLQAHLILGSYYSTGEIVTKDEKKAFMYYERAAKMNDSDGLLKLGICYKDGKGTALDKEKAFEMIKKAAQKENLSAKLQLALMYKDGVGVKQNVEETIRILNVIAEKSDIALVYLGEFYEEGKYIGKDIEKAKSYYRQAAICGIPLAESKYGNILYYEGKYKDAFETIKLAAEDKRQPVAEAMRKMAAFYRYGLNVVEPDSKKEKYWMDEAAKHHDAIAIDILQNSLGVTNNISYQIK